ncbi:type IV pilus biogenesis protein PilM [Inhella proteolytica]|uniref:Agglutinin biogenesis protein MshI n=1 Tax=Inhella proteolytica TaxID=2795029 RepID=A0A931NFN8_9BURK|nr:hypothetical protein [Inhella proteolytica]MBH9579002.1 hypothetical protein [Inhella proteolytica]
MPLLRARTEPGWTALVPQGDTLRAAHLLPAAAGRPARLAWHWQGPWGEQEAVRSASLAALHKAHGGRARRVWVLERGHYQIVPTEAPPDVPREEWKDALRWQLKGQLDFSAEDAALDLLILPSDQHQRRQTQLLAVLAPKHRLRELAAQADAQRLGLEAIDIPETALRNLSARLEPENRAQALLSFGSGQGSLVITQGGELLMFRQIELAAEALAHEDDARRDAALDRAALEVQRTLDNFDRMFSHLSLARVLVAPGPGMAGLVGHLGRLVTVQVEALDVQAVLDLSAAPDLQGAEAARWLLALGAALRE